MKPLRLRTLPRCLVCASTASRPAPDARPNAYSERLAVLLGCDEASLLEACANVECLACGLVRKLRFPQQDIMDALFRDELPAHPKGWDAMPGRFGPERYAAVLAEYEACIESADAAGRARCHRTLAGLLREHAAPGLHADLLEALAGGQVAPLRAALPALACKPWQPRPFGRYVGFSEPSLWRWFESQLGPIGSYAEVGCPLWGFLARPPHDRVRMSYFLADWPNYWGAGCHERGLSCRERIAAAPRVDVRPWASPPAERVDLLGAFQFLDHLEDPPSFVAQSLERARALALVLDGCVEPCAVQHLSAWSARAIDELARRTGVRMLTGFEPIRAAGNEVYLLVDD